MEYIEITLVSYLRRLQSIILTFIQPTPSPTPSTLPHATIFTHTPGDMLSNGFRFRLEGRSNSETNLAAQHRNLVTALTKKHGLTGMAKLHDSVAVEPFGF